MYEQIHVAMWMLKLKINNNWWINMQWDKIQTDGCSQSKLKREKTSYIIIVISLIDVPGYKENLLFLNSQLLSWQSL